MSFNPDAGEIIKKSYVWNILQFFNEMSYASKKLSWNKWFIDFSVYLYSNRGKDQKNWVHHSGHWQWLHHLARMWRDETQIAQCNENIPHCSLSATNIHPEAPESLPVIDVTPCGIISNHSCFSLGTAQLKAKQAGVECLVWFWQKSESRGLCTLAVLWKCWGDSDWLNSTERRSCW